MTVEDIQDLLRGVSCVLTALRDFPVLEELTERDSYYTMTDLTVGDAIQAVDEIVEGLENVNAFEGDEKDFPKSFLTNNLEQALLDLSELSAAIVRHNRMNRPSENKTAAKEAARQSGHDISEWL